MVGSISDPDDKIATDLSSQGTTENRYATGVISVTGFDICCSWLTVTKVDYSSFTCTCSGAQQDHIWVENVHFCLDEYTWQTCINVSAVIFYNIF